MYGRKQLTLGDGLLLALIGLGIFASLLLSNTSLLWNGVTTQGVITDMATVNCGGRSGGMGQEFSVRFTDQAGKVHTSTISQCGYSGFNASPGDSVAIVYLPDDPTVIAPPDGLISKVWEYLIVTILCGLLTLILLPLWIRKRIPKLSLQDKPELTKLSAIQIQQDRAELSAKRDQQEQTDFSADT